MDGARRSSRLLMWTGKEEARKSNSARFKADHAVFKEKNLADKEAR